MLAKIYFKGLLIILLFSSFYSFTQTIDDYINGYKEGFRIGYCQSELTCSAPIPNSRSIFIGRPLQYPVGYAKGLEDGKQKRINDNKNKLIFTPSTTNTKLGSKDPIMTTNKTNKSKSNNDYWELRGIEDNSANYETAKTNTSPNWTDKSKVNNDYWELRGIEDNSVISAEEYFNKGKKKYDFSAYNGAIGDFTKAIEISSSYWEAYFYRGIAKGIINDDVGAIEDLTLVTTNSLDKRMVRQARGWIRTIKKTR